MYLLDTNIVSELRKPRPSANVVSWLNTIPDKDIFLAAITLGEIQAGIELTRNQDSAKANILETWADQVSQTYNILPMDANIFRIWAKLMHKESNTVYEDAMIAATAIAYNLTVVTRNIKDFKRFEVQTLNPFD